MMLSAHTEHEQIVELLEALGGWLADSLPMRCDSHCHLMPITPVCLMQKVDIWACGIILFAMLYGRYPFNAEEGKRFVAAVMAGRCTIPRGIKVSLLHMQQSGKLYVKLGIAIVQCDSGLRLCGFFSNFSSAAAVMMNSPISLTWLQWYSSWLAALSPS